MGTEMSEGHKKAFGGKENIKSVRLDMCMCAR